MPEFTSLDRPDEDRDNRVVIFLGGPWDRTMRKVPVQWGMHVRVPHPVAPSVAVILDEGGAVKVTDYTLRYLVLAQQLICVATSSIHAPNRYDEDQAVQVILEYALKGMINGH